MSGRRKGEPVHGWLVLDKPVGAGSTRMVGEVKRLFAADKAGHAGTLDPLASGLLPIALGEATKTVSFIMDGSKTYRFSIAWGEETPSDDGETAPTALSDERPTQQAILAALPGFTGTLMQVPPRFSAVKVEGERAYDLAREGVETELAPRPVEIARLELVAMPDRDHAEFETDCGKGAYIRALARDLGRALGCLGRVAALRRTRVGPFGEGDMISLESLRQLRHKGAGPQGLISCLRPLETALDDIPALAVSQAEASRLKQGQPILLRGRDAPIRLDAVYVTWRREPIAIGSIEGGVLKPRRVFNLG
jgi:tRNA pseudouridine55 synthase